MSDRITPERLAEIQDRVDNATPGPWGVGNRTEIALDARQDSPGCFSYTVKLATVIEDDDRQNDVYYLNPTTQPPAVASAEDDALFIAHARQDVEDLLAEVDRLNAQIVTYDRLDRVAIGDWEREVDRLKTELAEMESAASDWAARLIEEKSKTSQAESRIAEAFDLASRLDPSCGRGRVQAFISDLRRALGRAVSL